jgi:hypothetical protein
MQSNPKAIGSQVLEVFESGHGRGLRYTGITADSIPKDNGTYVLFYVYLIVPPTKIPAQYKQQCYVTHPKNSDLVLIDPSWISYSSRPLWTFFNSRQTISNKTAKTKFIYVNEDETEYVLEIYADLDCQIAMSEMFLDYAW